MVSKGTVVLPQDANLPRGTDVRVEPLPAKPLSERLSDVTGIVPGGPPSVDAACGANKNLLLNIKTPGAGVAAPAFDVRRRPNGLR